MVYRSDGSGRDSYVLREAGGLRQDRKSLNQYQLKDFLRTPCDHVLRYVDKKDDKNIKWVSKKEIEVNKFNGKINSGIVDRLYQKELPKCKERFSKNTVSNFYVNRNHFPGSNEVFSEEKPEFKNTQCEPQFSSYYKDKEEWMNKDSYLMGKGPDELKQYRYNYFLAKKPKISGQASKSLGNFRIIKNANTNSDREIVDACASENNPPQMTNEVMGLSMNSNTKIPLSEIPKKNNIHNPLFTSNIRVDSLVDINNNNKRNINGEFHKIKKEQAVCSNRTNKENRERKGSNNMGLGTESSLEGFNQSGVNNRREVESEMSPTRVSAKNLNQLYSAPYLPNMNNYSSQVATKNYLPTVNSNYNQGNNTDLSHPGKLMRKKKEQAVCSNRTNKENRERKGINNMVLGTESNIEGFNQLGVNNRREVESEMSPTRISAKNLNQLYSAPYLPNMNNYSSQVASKNYLPTVNSNYNQGNNTDLSHPRQAYEKNLRLDLNQSKQPPLIRLANQTDNTKNKKVQDNQSQTQEFRPTNTTSCFFHRSPKNQNCKSLVNFNKSLEMEEETLPKKERDYVQMNEYFDCINKSIMTKKKGIYKQGKNQNKTEIGFYSNKNKSGGLQEALAPNANPKKSFQIIDDYLRRKEIFG
eukprot:CAMPEP_0170538830 /NCGR_PEP_ID=MMETSP0209-20121228/103554_1 /TAXON_ID=665100 ORGANISM="Litonotus pictus, Strain P1" /NCGR_SAMPLE_ID=MMETSP0209 /ASSEMBLY_ACC=CAM_ASM_000301 /LENGTH=640 /DNA_ID=CAMNT_0010840615 /DNA_START=128 /DNA_END=2051 /DNA_ORIENTATION=+